MEAQNQRPKLCEKPKDLPPPGLDRDSVRRGKVFATQEEQFYVKQLIQMTKDYEEQHKPPVHVSKSVSIPGTLASCDSQETYTP